MTRKEILQQKIDDSGLKIGAICNALGIKSYATFRARMADPTSFSAKEIIILMELLNLSEEDRNRIFFIDYVA